jgi:hypothetical protein
MSVWGMELAAYLHDVRLVPAVFLLLVEYCCF